MDLSKLKNEYRTVDKKIEKDIARDLAFQTGLQIEELRILRGVTQEKLAKMIGTKQTSISRAEGGSVLQSLRFLEKIASALGTYLIGPKFAAVEEMSVETGVQHSILSFIQISTNKSTWNCPTPKPRLLKGPSLTIGHARAIEYANQ